MTIIETYLLLFTDIIVANIAINTSYEMVIDVMKFFGTYNNYLIVIISTIAYFFASCINYTFGIMFCKILTPLKTETTNNNISKILKICYKYIFILILISATPVLGKFMVLLAGFYRFNFPLVVLGASGAKLLYYIYFVVY